MEVPRGLVQIVLSASFWNPEDNAAAFKSRCLYRLTFLFRALSPSCLALGPRRAIRNRVSLVDEFDTAIHRTALR